MNKHDCVDKTHYFLIKKGNKRRKIKCDCGKYWMETDIKSTQEGEIGIDTCTFFPDRVRSLSINGVNTLRMNY